MRGQIFSATLLVTSEVFSLLTFCIHYQTTESVRFHKRHLLVFVSTKIKALMVLLDG